MSSNNNEQPPSTSIMNEGITSNDQTNEKPNSDSTPTSSTDTSTTLSTLPIVSEDHLISSTSTENSCEEETKQSPESSSYTLPESSKILSSSSIVSEKDLLDLNITDTSDEKITEDVEDLVQDLEYLLGEPTVGYDFKKETKSSTVENLTTNIEINSSTVETESKNEVEGKSCNENLELEKIEESEAFESHEGKEKPNEDEQKMETPEIEPIIEVSSNITENVTNINKNESEISKDEVEIEKIEPCESTDIEIVNKNEDLSLNKINSTEESIDVSIKHEKNVKKDEIEEESMEIENIESEHCQEIEGNISQISIESIKLKSSLEKSEIPIVNPSDSGEKLEETEPEVSAELEVEKTDPIEDVGKGIVNENDKEISQVIPSINSDQVSEVTSGKNLEEISDIIPKDPNENEVKNDGTTEDISSEKNDEMHLVTPEKSNISFFEVTTKTIDDNISEKIEEVTEEMKVEVTEEIQEITPGKDVEIPEDKPQKINEVIVEESSINTLASTFDEIPDTSVDLAFESTQKSVLIPDETINGDSIEEMDISENNEEIDVKDTPALISEEVVPDTSNEDVSDDAPNEEILTGSVEKNIENSPILEEKPNAVSEQTENLEKSSEKPDQISEEKVSEIVDKIEDTPELDSELPEAFEPVFEEKELKDSNEIEKFVESNKESPLKDESKIENEILCEEKIEEKSNFETIEKNEVNSVEESSHLPEVEETIIPNPTTSLLCQTLTNPEFHLMKKQELNNFETKMQLDEIKESQAVASVKKHKLSEPLVIKIDDNSEKERISSPKMIIKQLKQNEYINEFEEKETNTNINKLGSLKMTITKQSDNTHSILKVFEPGNENNIEQQVSVPKLIIKSIPNEQQQSPKCSKTSNSSSKVFSPSQRSGSPRITIKPIPKPPEECLNPLKITIKPVLKSTEESSRQKHSPKLTIKPIRPPINESGAEDENHHLHSPRITIKPIVKPPEQSDNITGSSNSPKITIKPIKPDSGSSSCTDMELEGEESVKERIVLKINRVKEQEKLGKIKLKLSKEGNPHIVPPEEMEGCGKGQKRTANYTSDQCLKRLKADEDVTITPIYANNTRNIEEQEENVPIIEQGCQILKLSSPIVITSEDSNSIHNTVEDATKDAFRSLKYQMVEEERQQQPLQEQRVEEIISPPVIVTPRKRGRPRKVPLEVREDFSKDSSSSESSRPRRSCTGQQSARVTLGMKTRKPRGGGRGRGSKRGMGARTVSDPDINGDEEFVSKEALIGTPLKRKYQKRKKLDSSLIGYDKFDQLPPVQLGNTINQDFNAVVDHNNIAMFEEETRMSADSSRAQTPAKQVVNHTVVVEIEESQSSVLSTGTTESLKAASQRRTVGKVEVEEPEGAVVSADQLAEYYWSGGGPYMLQEQVAQFLGIKSFKRKYPNIARRVVDMQERDFIRESGLAGESMCDLGLTAVNSTDILDIMYSDFQEKYEEYCKHQRDRQAKELTNKQKALLGLEKKMDLTQQAIQSAASWNSNFNKVRKNERKACVDLQTFTINFPKGKMKQISRGKIGNYPIALVPGQFSDYYREFTPEDINNLPINTIGDENNPLFKKIEVDFESQTTDDGSDGSDSDSSSSDSDSSYTGSSEGEENCTLCKHSPSNSPRSSNKKITT